MYLFLDEHAFFVFLPSVCADLKYFSFQSDLQNLHILPIKSDKALTISCHFAFIILSLANSYL